MLEKVSSKRAVIAHCWEGHPDYCWYPYVKKELEKRGFSVEVPAFPDTNLPKMDKWVPYLKKIIGKPDKKLYLIGHSIGCAAILRYLEDLKEDQKVGGVILVAGFTENVGYDEIQSFFNSPFDLKKIKSKSARGFVAINSDDDPYVDLKYANIFKKELGAEIIIKHGAKHFSGAIEGEESYLKFSEVVKSVEKMEFLRVNR